MKLFPKTQYACGLKSPVNIEDTVSELERLCMAADEFMQINVAYRRYMEPSLAAAEHALLDRDTTFGAVDSFLLRGYNVVNMQTGRLKYTDGPSYAFGKLSVAYRKGVF